MSGQADQGSAASARRVRGAAEPAVVADQVRTVAPVGRDPGRVIWAVAGICWLLLVALLMRAPDATDRHSEAFQFDRYPGAVPTLVTFATAALAAVVAMVLPVVVPTARMVTTTLCSVARPAPVWALATAGWLAVWLVFTGVALTGDAALHKLVAASDWLRTRNAFLFLAAVALVVAGLAQFIPVTRRCLTRCRDPRAFLIQHYRHGLDGAWALGVRQASCCLGWCWPYLLVIFVLGIGALGWMAVVTTLMLAETCARRGPQLVVPVGVALLAIGTWLGLSEWLTPGFADVSVPAQGHQH